MYIYAYKIMVTKSLRNFKSSLNIIRYWNIFTGMCNEINVYEIITNGSKISTLSFKMRDK